MDVFMVLNVNKKTILYLQIKILSLEIFYSNNKLQKIDNKGFS